MSEFLKMSFDPATIEHLGVKMYSKLPNAIAELIANAYDADASEVKIELYDKDEKMIIVQDNGTGMSFEEINDCFLRIGRNRRKEGQTTSPSRRRKVTGRKGLGKLSLFGIGNIIEVQTIKQNSGKKITFILDWDELLTAEEKDYQPKFNEVKCDKKLKGTKITLRNLQRKTDFDKIDLAVSLSKLFNLFDKTFVVYISRNEDTQLKIDEKLKYENIETDFEWEYSSLVENFEIEYKKKKEINGKIIASPKPLTPGLRGITLFANGRLVNAPEFFGISESSHGYSYFTGWLEVDFVDDWTEDVISTHRQSLNWDTPKTVILREYLKKLMSHLERVWREKRKEQRKTNLSTRTNINIVDWLSKLPAEIRNNLEPIVNTIDEKSELSTEELSNTVSKLHSLIPEYPRYHWRHIHEEIQKVSKSYYTNEDYYTAFLEALKRYINEVRIKSGSTNGSERSMMGEVFSNRKLSVTKIYKKRNGDDFSTDTIKNIEEGQQYLSEGIVMGGRHPLAHEEHIELNETGLFSEKDCLDFLSLLSHLFKRLEDAEKT
nr:TIGR02391 family protein [uncultured Sphaerochaeta sp.]